MTTFKEKLSSGKFFATVCIIGTYCIIMIGAGVAVFLKRIDGTSFVSMLVGFGTLAGSIVTFYFTKPKQEV